MAILLASGGYFVGFWWLLVTCVDFRRLLLAFVAFCFCWLLVDQKKIPKKNGNKFLKKKRGPLHMTPALKRHSRIGPSLHSRPRPRGVIQMDIPGLRPFVPFSGHGHRLSTEGTEDARRPASGTTWDDQSQSVDVVTGAPPSSMLSN